MRKKALWGFLLVVLALSAVGSWMAYTSIANPISTTPNPNYHYKGVLTKDTTLTHTFTLIRRVTPIPPGSSGPDPFSIEDVVLIDDSSHIVSAFDKLSSFPFTYPSDQEHSQTLAKITLAVSDNTPAGQQAATFAYLLKSGLDTATWYQVLSVDVEESAPEVSPDIVIVADPTEMQLNIAEEQTLTCRVIPADAPQPSINFRAQPQNQDIIECTSTTDPLKIKIKGLKAGTVDVIFEASNGKTAKCVVTVVDKMELEVEAFGNPKRAFYSPGPFNEGIITGFDNTGYKNYKWNNSPNINEEMVSKIPKSSIYRVGGVAADGISRILCRATLTSLGSITDLKDCKIVFTNHSKYNIKFDNLSRDYKGTDGKGREGNISLSLTPIADGKYQATAVLTAPDWVDVASVSVSITAEAYVGGQKVAPCEIKTSTGESNFNIKSVPVILIHGLWVDNHFWRKKVAEIDGVYKRLETFLGDNNIHMFPHGGLAGPGTEGPGKIMAPNRRDFYNFVFSALENYEDREKIISSAVDVVGHSMGGLMIRKFLLDNTSKNGRLLSPKDQPSWSYETPIVRRVITINTPHRGAQIAEELVNNKDAIAGRGNLSYWIYRLLYWLEWKDGKDGDPARRVTYDNGKLISAIDDLNPKGTFISNDMRPNEQNQKKDVPIVAVSGEIFDNAPTYNEKGKLIVDNPGSFFYFKITQEGQKTKVWESNWETWYSRQPSDGTVTVSSQQASFNSVPFSGSTQYEHAQITRETNVGNKIVELLSGSLEQFNNPTKPAAQSMITVTQKITNRQNHAFEASPPSGWREVELVEKEIDFPVNQTVKPGETLKISIDTPAPYGSNIGGYAYFAGIQYPLRYNGQGQFTADIPVHTLASGVRQLGILIMEADEDKRTIWTSPTKEIIVIPDAQIQSLRIVEGDAIILVIDIPVELGIKATYDDGIERYINWGKLGTTYESEDMAIVTVNDDGVLTGHKAGETRVIVRNRQHSAAIKVKVSGLPNVVNIDDPNTSISIDLSSLNLQNNTLALKSGEEIDATITSDPAGATFTAMGLPLGITLDSDGHLYGSAPKTGSYPVTVNASLNGSTASASFTIVVKDDGGSTDPQKSSGGSGGCNVGAGAFALAALAIPGTILYKRKKG